MSASRTDAALDAVDLAGVARLDVDLGSAFKDAVEPDFADERRGDRNHFVMTRRV